MNFQFVVYVSFYLIPIWMTLFTDNEQFHEQLLNMACGPSIMLFMIELIQIKKTGLNYFAGWNIVDLV